MAFVHMALPVCQGQKCAVSKKELSYLLALDKSKLDIDLTLNCRRHSYTA